MPSILNPEPLTLNHPPYHPLRRRTEARLASQLALDAVAVTTWFRARRALP